MTADLAGLWGQLTADQRRQLAEGLGETELQVLAQEVGVATTGWDLEAHQQPPAWDWKGWALLSGRDGGKSFAGAHYLHDIASTTPRLRARIIAPTYDDAVASVIEGDSGVLRLSYGQVRWKPSHPGGSQLQWPNGSVCYVIGMDTPRAWDRLRAITNVGLDVWEEAAAIRQLGTVFRLASFSLRKPPRRWVAMTTPRALDIISGWETDPMVAVTRASSHQNPHADREWLADMDQYKGTRLYRREILGEIVAGVDGALWTPDGLDRSRVSEAPDLDAVAVGVDPPATVGTCGIVVAGKTDRDVYAVEDCSVGGRENPAEPEKWGAAVVEAAARWDATIVAETNQGGKMVGAVLRSAGCRNPVKTVHASKGKQTRAEPVSLLWETDPPRGHIVGRLPMLEDQLVSWMPGDESPDRLDALVWACSWLQGRSGSMEVWKPTRRIA